MSIVDAFAEALEEADRLATHPGRGRSGPFKNWHPTVQESWRTRARAALRSVKPSNITDAMCDAMCDAFWGAPAADDIKLIYREQFRNAWAAAAIAAGAE